MEPSAFDDGDHDGDAEDVVVVASSPEDGVAPSPPAEAPAGEAVPPLGGGPEREDDNDGVAPVADDAIEWETLPNTAFDEIVARVM
jgi:hypothetical protein